MKAAGFGVLLTINTLHRTHLDLMQTETTHSTHAHGKVTTKWQTRKRPSDIYYIWAARSHNKRHAWALSYNKHTGIQLRTHRRQSLTQEEQKCFLDSHSQWTDATFPWGFCDFPVALATDPGDHKNRYEPVKPKLKLPSCKILKTHLNGVWETSRLKVFAKSGNVFIYVPRTDCNQGITKKKRALYISSIDYAHSNWILQRLKSIG